MITDKGMQARPTDKDQWLIQPFRRGAGVFIGRITPAGERLFYFRYTDSTGKRPFLPIGSYHPKGKGGMTVAQAQTKAEALSATYKSGIKDLREHLEREQLIAQHAQAQELLRIEEAERKAELAHKQRVTLRILFDRWQETELVYRERSDGQRMGRKDSGALAKAQFERYVFPQLGERTASEITKAEVVGTLDAQTSAGKQRTAQMLFSDLRQMFAFALDRELISANPMATLKKTRLVGKPVERDRILSLSELKLLRSAIPMARMSPRTVIGIWLILATGVRGGELMGAVWPHPGHLRSELEAQAEANELKLGLLDVAARTWHIPDTKNGREHTIHLSAFALNLIQQLRTLRELTPWCFPSGDGAGPVCGKSFAKQIADRQRDANTAPMSRRSSRVDALVLPGGRWTPHDLRRTAASLMASLGVSGDVIDECLNHVIESKVRRTYIRDRREADQALAFEALGEHLQAIWDSSPPLMLALSGGEFSEVP